jgi:hypothetical protein
MRRNVFGRYFSALAEGDPVALGVTGLFVVVLIVVGLVAWKSKREERRQEEEKRKRWGLKDPKARK